MNRTALTIILAAALVLPPVAAVHGQAPPAAAANAQAVDAQAPPKPAVALRRVRSHADARACLEFATNLEVIACAEKYR